VKICLETVAQTKKLDTEQYDKLLNKLKKVEKDAERKEKRLEEIKKQLGKKLDSLNSCIDKAAEEAHMREDLKSMVKDQLPRLTSREEQLRRAVEDSNELLGILKEMQAGANYDYKLKESFVNKFLGEVHDLHRNLRKHLQVNDTYKPVIEAAKNKMRENISKEELALLLNSVIEAADNLDKMGVQATKDMTVMRAIQE
jgi:DNA repair exonuclease SbcCD ATPase subunit